MTNGVINFLKPSGMSSAKIVNIVKHAFHGEKVGHLGTLDPNATGVLPIAVGKATRLFEYYLNKTKTYFAVFKFGITTDTLDSEGVITGECDKIPSEQELKNSCKQFIGKISQIPPMYSAKNVNGERAYTLARRGETVELKPKEIEIFSMDLVGKIDETSYQFKIHCSSGTYIRSICRDIALCCGTVAYMPQLIRTQAGEFNISNAVTLEDFKNGQYTIIGLKELLNALPRVEISKELCEKLLNGIKVPYNCQFEKFTLFCGEELLGIASIENGNLKIQTFLRS